MEKLPTAFAERLRLEFDGRYRFRWSTFRRVWQLEYKTRSAVLPPVRIRETEFDADDLIRYTDGYELVFSMQPSPRMACPRCGLALPVPVKRFAEAECEYCQTLKRDGRYAAGYFPWGDDLIQHIRRISAELTWRDNTKRMFDEKNKQREQLQMDGASREGAAVLRDEWGKMVDIPRVSFGGMKRFGESR